MKLEEIIKNQKAKERSESLQLGFFSKPFFCETPPFENKIIKVYYRPQHPDYIKKIKALHDDYVIALKKAGFSIPNTELHQVKPSKRPIIAIVQDAYPEESLVRYIMQRCELKEYLEMTRGIISEAVRYVNYTSNNPDRFGFHPTLRNYAYHDGEFHYFDTFPPMEGISERQLQEIIIDFAPYRFANLLRPLALKQMNRVTNEYYHYDKMILGIIGSACRLRPEFAEAVIASAKQCIHQQIDGDLEKRIMAILDSPPKLPWIWTTVRKALGKKGRPNI